MNQVKVYVAVYAQDVVLGVGATRDHAEKIIREWDEDGSCVRFCKIEEHDLVGAPEVIDCGPRLRGVER